MSQNFFEERQLEFGKDITEKCFRIFSRRGNWNLVKTLLKNVLEYFRSDTIGIWQRQGLDLSKNIFKARIKL